MAARKTSVQDEILKEDAWKKYLANNSNIICMEVYCEFFGLCIALQGTMTKLKFDFGEEISLAAAMSDNIPDLERFRGHSEPLYLVISRGSYRAIMWGANPTLLRNLITREMELEKKADEAKNPRKYHPISDLLPEELVRQAAKDDANRKLQENLEQGRREVMDTRRRRRAELVAPFVTAYNFILFWPHSIQAHNDLYHYWDDMGMRLFSKETHVLTEDEVKDIIWLSGTELSEAALWAVTQGESQAMCFNTYTGSDPMEDMHSILYDAPVKEVDPLEPVGETAENVVIKSPYEIYLTHSKDPEEIIRQRREERKKNKVEEKLKRKQQQQVERRLTRELFKDRNGKIKETEDENKNDPEEEEQTHSDSESEEPEPEEEIDEGYLPPGGLPIPGFYSPPNDLARAHGMILLFPKVVKKEKPIETIDFPPHIIMMFKVDKRDEIKKMIQEMKDDILNIGFFMGTEPSNCEHVAYTFKHYERRGRKKYEMEDRLVLQVSRQSSMPSLLLVPLKPTYISPLEEDGEKEANLLFPVYYGDEYEESDSENENEEET